MTHDQRRAKPSATVRDFCPPLIVRHRAWYHTMEQRSSRRESQGWFFFLARVVHSLLMHPKKRAACSWLRRKDNEMSLKTSFFCPLAIDLDLTTCSSSFSSARLSSYWRCCASRVEMPDMVIQRCMQVSVENTTPELYLESWHSNGKDHNILQTPNDLSNRIHQISYLNFSVMSSKSFPGRNFPRSKDRVHAVGTTRLGGVWLPQNVYARWNLVCRHSNLSMVHMQTFIFMVMYAHLQPF